MTKGSAGIGDEEVNEATGMKTVTGVMTAEQ